MLVADTIKLEPGPGSFTEEPRNPGGYLDAIAVLYVFTRGRPAAELAMTVRAALEEDAQTVNGVSELPNRAGISVRILGSSAYYVDRARTTAWNAAREALIGAPAPNMRKG